MGQGMWEVGAELLCPLQGITLPASAPVPQLEALQILSFGVFKGSFIT